MDRPVHDCVCLSRTPTCMTTCLSTGMYMYIQAPDMLLLHASCTIMVYWYRISCSNIMQHGAIMQAGALGGKELAGRGGASQLHEGTISEDGETDNADELPVPCVSHLGVLPIEQVRVSWCLDDYPPSRHVGVEVFGCVFERGGKCMYMVCLLVHRWLMICASRDPLRTIFMGQALSTGGQSPVPPRVLIYLCSCCFAHLWLCGLVLDLRSYTRGCTHGCMAACMAVLQVEHLRASNGAGAHAHNDEAGVIKLAELQALVCGAGTACYDVCAVMCVLCYAYFKPASRHLTMCGLCCASSPCSPCMLCPSCAPCMPCCAGVHTCMPCRACTLPPLPAGLRPWYPQ